MKVLDLMVDFIKMSKVGAYVWCFMAHGEKLPFDIFIKSPVMSHVAALLRVRAQPVARGH